MPWCKKHLRWGLIALIVLYTIAYAVAAEEGEYQTMYRRALDPQNIKLNFENLTAKAHIAGSDMDHSSAQIALDKFRKYGFENSWIEETQVTVSYPNHRHLLVLNSTGLIHNATLEEPPIADDPTSYQTDIVPTFNGYSPSGNVTAPVVFVNYGSVEDYETLNRLNISVSGKIVLARYGKLFRGCKVMLAELHGAVGVILYSDPNDDGIGRGTPYPDGPWRPFDGVQRGSVQYLSKCPGDPDRNHTDCQNNLPKIPVQPISARDAEPIITNLRGTAYNWTTWWSNTTTYLGDNNAIRVNLDLKMDFVRKPIWNVYAQIDGVEKDRTLIIGAHRDAWVFGGADPATGSSVLLEIAHGLGEIKQSRWVPARSILLVSWDGEEYGLLGSTWFGEINKRTIQDETIAYLNLDMAAYGNRFVVDATPSLNSIIREIATQVTHPNTNTSIATSWDGKINRLGSGSDYTVFIHHLGIPSAHFSFEGDYGVYHSIYDSTTWVEKFGDPTFMMHKAMAEYVGLLAMNITDSDIFPFNYTDYAHELSVYFNETMQLVSKMNASSEVNLQPLEAAIKNFTQVAHDLDKEIKHVNLEDVQDVMSLNDRLIDAEKPMLDDGGLPQRPWYKHQIQAPGYYLGYGSEIFPGITQSLNEKNWTAANQYILTIAKCITNSSNVLSKEEDSYGLVSNESYLGYQIFMILFTVIIIGSFVGAIWYFRRSRKQYHKNSRYAMMEMDEQL